MGVVSDLMVGQAGQCLAMADLLLRGIPCFPAAEGMPYDLVMDVEGRLFRLQVKTTHGPVLRSKTRSKTPCYFFHVRRCGKGGKRIYPKDAFDGFCFVDLETKLVAYMPYTEEVNRAITLRDRRKNYLPTNGPKSPYLDELTLDRFLEHCEDKYGDRFVKKVDVNQRGFDRDSETTAGPLHRCGDL